MKEIKIMEQRMKKHAALCMLIAIVDENNGEVEINSPDIKRVFNDENDIVKVELANGDVVLAADQSYESLNNAVLKWKKDNPGKLARTLEKLK